MGQILGGSMLQASPLCEVCNWRGGGRFGGGGNGSVEVADESEVVRR